MARILIVDDEANMRRVLSVVLTEDGHTVIQAPGVTEAIAALHASTIDVVVTDHCMRDGDGFAVLASSVEADPLVPVVFLTAFATVELAVEAMRRGAFDFITKPFVPDVVCATIRRASERAELLRENARLKGEVERLGFDESIIGASAPMRELLETIVRVAPTNATVLITGETGTGKELVARAIHKGSPRAGASFVAVNCAAFPETLLDSELFGHEKGAFTGADRPRRGLFEAAHRGTLFLDEAGEMPASLQAKLLRVLAEGQITRVGSTALRQVDVRIIAATHRNLSQRVRDGLFRDDLFYRLSVIPIDVPPLRERGDDIRLLVEHYLAQTARDLNLPARRVHPSALTKLASYSFPGNVRELRNLIERACILARSEEIGPDDLVLGVGELTSTETEGDMQGEWLSSLPDSFDIRATVEAIEVKLIKRALDAAGGVQAKAARNLGLSRSDLAYKLKKQKELR